MDQLNDLQAMSGLAEKIKLLEQEVKEGMQNAREVLDKLPN